MSAKSSIFIRPTSCKQMGSEQQEEELSPSSTLLIFRVQRDEDQEHSAPAQTLLPETPPPSLLRPERLVSPELQRPMMKLILKQRPAAGSSQGAAQPQADEDHGAQQLPLKVLLFMNVCFKLETPSPPGFSRFPGAEKCSDRLSQEQVQQVVSKPRRQRLPQEKGALGDLRRAGAHPRNVLCSSRFLGNAGVRFLQQKSSEACCKQRSFTPCLEGSSIPDLLSSSPPSQRLFVDVRPSLLRSSSSTDQRPNVVLLRASGRRCCPQEELHKDMFLTPPSFCVYRETMNELSPSSVSMLSIIWLPGSPEKAPQDETLQYLFILSSKVLLDALVLSFWRRSILKSLLGICSISVYVADLLMVCVVFSAWLLREHLSTSISMCFILAHGSTLYSLLPLPVLIAGALDYASYPNLDMACCSPRRVLTYWIMVVLFWVLASIYTSFNTNTEPFEIYQETLRVTVCRVQESLVACKFSLFLMVATALVLLVYLRKLSGWIRRACKLYKSLLGRGASYSALGADEEHAGASAPLGVSLTLGFAVSWMPFLLMCLMCATVGFVVPAYASVNLLWMACANSLLVGITFWFRGSRTGPFVTLPDDTCVWNIYWHLSHRTPASIEGLYIPIHETQEV
ncbi:hypothetical protein DNTS_022992 [Danionella cerebrum]|uniref:G-protein coupled receptors family 1 profile domain-containing protein n=1 Tax=Danionella cerebrum TaxID=2873325 RepID=A0A553RBA4_9TELE|nr:hypothetical protein DNTS_022992 [Danionella translucida]